MVFFLVNKHLSHKITMSELISDIYMLVPR
jgi:hypothetical protein